MSRSSRRARVRARALIVAVVGLGPWLPPAAPSDTTQVTGVCGQAWSSAVQIGLLPGGLGEVSGFVSSSRYPGVAWMIRDSGNPHSLYSFELDGDQPRWKEFPISGVSNHDWEDVAYTVGSDGRGRLWILENVSDTSPKKIYEVLEPDPRTDRSAHLVGTYGFEYPGGNVDTETLLALGGRLVVVAKTSPNRVYRLPFPLSRTGVNGAVDVGSLDASSLLTMGSTSGDDRLLVTVSTSDVVSVFENLGGSGDITGFVAPAPIFSRSMAKTQREAGDFFPYDACDIVLVSEDATVWRLSNPHSIVPPAAPGVPAGVSATAGDSSVTVSWSAPADNGGTGITGYLVTAYQGSSEVVSVATPDGATTSTVVSGLSNGVTYTFTVTAIAGSGLGPASAPSDPVTPAAPPPAVVLGEQPPRFGYWMIESGGVVHAFGAARHLGEPSAGLGSAAAVDLEPTPSSDGYWVVDDGGRVHAYGGARHFGDVDRGRLVPGEMVTSLSRTPAANGYWIFTSRGRVLTFGDAGFFGDMAHLALNGPVLDSISTPTGLGYYMVASDGGVFTFGDARFYGSMGGVRLNAPVHSLVPDPDGVGYWLVASDGGVFSFEAPFRGSMAAVPLNRPVVGMVAFGNGYLMVGEDGGVFNFSDRPFLGSLGGWAPDRPIVSVAVLDQQPG